MHFQKSGPPGSQTKTLNIHIYSALLKRILCVEMPVQIGYGMMEAVLLALFPELKPTIQRLHHEATQPQQPQPQH